MIDWDKLDFRFETRPIMDPFRLDVCSTNDEMIHGVALRAITQHNVWYGQCRLDIMNECFCSFVCSYLLTKFCIQGSRIELVDHVSASYRWCAGILYWVTFLARDLASSDPEPRLYQAKVRLCGPTFCQIYIFRLRPTDEGIFMKPLFQLINHP